MIFPTKSYKTNENKEMKKKKKLFWQMNYLAINSKENIEFSTETSAENVFCIAVNRKGYVND